MDLKLQPLKIEIEDVALTFDPVLETDRFDIVDLPQLTPREQHKKLYNKLQKIEGLTMEGEPVTVEDVKRGVLPGSFLQKVTMAYIKAVLKELGVEGVEVEAEGNEEAESN